MWRTSLAGMLAIGANAVAADSDDKPSPRARDRFRTGTSLGLNVGAQFTGIGGFTAQTAPGAAAGAGDRFYDDGFNRVDLSGFPDGKTWFWGYSNPGQAGAGTMAMNSFSSPATVSPSRFRDDPQFSLDLGYSRELGTIRNGHWGIAVGGSFTPVSIVDRRTLTADVNRLSDVFVTTGAAIPPAPYDGPPAGAVGPGPRIDNVPITRTTTTLPAGATITGQRELTADVFALRLGPFVELPFGKRFSIEAGAGMVLALYSSEFRFSQTTTIPGMGPALQPGVANAQAVTGSSSESGFIPGGYAELLLNYSFNQNWSAYAGCQYQHLGSFSQTAAGKVARLELGQIWLFRIGLGRSF